MGITASTSLEQLSENKVLEKFIGPTAVTDTDEYWDTLLTFSFNPPRKRDDFNVFYKAIKPLLEQLVHNNSTSNNVLSLIKVCMKKATHLRDESKCESNLSTLRVRNSLFILRCISYDVIQLHSERMLLQVVDASSSTPSTGETANPVMFGAKSDGDINIGSGIKILLHGIITLLCEVPLVPFTYDVHTEAINLLMLLLSGQLFSDVPFTSAIVQCMMEVPMEVSAGLVQALVNHFIVQPPSPPEYLRSQPTTGIVSSITSGLLSLVLPQRSIIDNTSPLALSSLLLLLILVHQHSREHNPYRDALSQFCDEKENKEGSSFQTSLEKLYLTLCGELSNEQTTLFFYQLLHSNLNFASFVFSRSNIDTLLVPLLKQLSNDGNQPSHQNYMLLIVLLILSQDDCFNKSIHEITLKNVTWAGEKAITQTSLGSLMVIVLVRTVHRNIQHLRDKFLHTNCLATLANMSSHFHSLSLEASEKIVNLFRVLSKRYLRSKGEVTAITSTEAEATSPSLALSTDQTDTQTLEEILQMILEIINSSLTYTLHVNPHFVYSLLYQREIFTPFHSRPGFIDLVQNIEMVITYFASSIEKDGHPPYSSQFVLQTIEKCSKSWPRNRLRTFSELKFRYVEESQPEEFFVPYVWTLVQKLSHLYFDPQKIRFSIFSH